MKLGQHILKLRKKQGLSQEQLGEKVNVTRQTISNWELDETTPNSEQLKSLSQVFNISIDELLDNETKEVLMKKVSNTEQLSGLTLKILRGFGKVAMVYLALVTLAIIGIAIYIFIK